MGVGRPSSNSIVKVIDPALSELPGVSAYFTGLQPAVDPSQPAYPPSWANSDC